MKKLIIKLDDIGRDSHRPIFDTVLWAMQEKLPVSIGTIGTDLATMPREVVELIKLGVKLGFVEIWNHGHRHIRYDQSSLETVRNDLTSGHTAIVDTFNVTPRGFGFPFNRYSEESLSEVRCLYPDYFVYEADLPTYKLLSPEFNSLADGQPRLSYFLERIGTGANSRREIILQAHPPRWTNGGFNEFAGCIRNLVEKQGFTCFTVNDALSCNEQNLAPAIGSSSGTLGVASGVKALSEHWENDSAEYIASLSNFKSYFLARFRSDAQKNWAQTHGVLYPFKPKRVIDIGCGLGNWSIPFWLAGDCNQLVLNDVNTTIIKALRSGIGTFKNAQNVVLDERNLLAIPESHGYQADLLVCANTFNYLEPISFFKFAQSCVVSGGRMLLMLQTGAFNKLRYRLALQSKDGAVGAEVLASDLAMLLRRHYGVFLSDVRHVFSAEEISKLAIMFDFSTSFRFAPSGESTEEGEHVYECLLFKKTNGMMKTIEERAEWYAECKEVMAASFGSRAFELAGFPPVENSNYASYYRDWILPETILADDRSVINQLKVAIDSLKTKKIVPIDMRESSVHPSLGLLVDKVQRFHNAFI